jgi:glycosyltransferase involved in cell wall biosynthesis
VSSPLVSVLLPCYQAAETLDQALDSLARQTFCDFEILAVDDGSTDATPAILDSWARRDRRLRLIRRRHTGIIEALNTSLAESRGTYLARMDADDISALERLERQAAFLDTHPDIAIVSCLVTGFPAGQIRTGFQLYIEWLNSLLEDSDIRREMFVESPIAHPSAMLRREWLEKIGGYQERGWPEDYDLWLRLYLAGARFAKVPAELLAWREAPERLTRRDNRYSVENFLRAKAYYLAQGPAKGKDAVFIWGAGMMGRRISKHLQRQNLPMVAFFDVDGKKIGSTRRGLPILAPEDLPVWWRRYQNPVLLVAVGARGARPIIRTTLSATNLTEGNDWWFTA